MKGIFNKLLDGSETILADLNGMTVYYFGQVVNPDDLKAGAYDGSIVMQTGIDTYSIMPPPLTSTPYQDPIVIPDVDVPSNTVVIYPSQHSQADMEKYARFNDGINMVTTLGGAFTLGLTGPLAGATQATAIQTTEFTSVGPAPEVFFRGMTSENYSVLAQTGRMPPGMHETFVSPTKAYAANYASDSGDVLVKFTLRPGTTNALTSIGVRDGAALTAEKYGELPFVQSGWKSSNAFFKAEGTQINIGLGHGPALNIFNDNLIRFTLQ